MKNYDFRITTDTQTITGSCGIGFSAVSGVVFVNLQSIAFNKPTDIFRVEVISAINIIRDHFISKLNEDFDSLSYSKTLYIDLRTPEKPTEKETSEWNTDAERAEC